MQINCRILPRDVVALCQSCETDGTANRILTPWGREHCVRVLHEAIIIYQMKVNVQLLETVPISHKPNIRAETKVLRSNCTDTVAWAIRGCTKIEAVGNQFNCKTSVDTDLLIVTNTPPPPFLPAEWHRRGRRTRERIESILGVKYFRSRYRIV